MFRQTRPAEPDQELVWRAREGDTRAFDALILKYGEKLHGLVCHMTSMPTSTCSPRCRTLGMKDFEISRVVFFIAKRAGLFHYRFMLVRTLLNLAIALLVIGLSSCCCLF